LLFCQISIHSTPPLIVMLFFHYVDLFMKKYEN
jgi:hypothetical protein